MSSYDQVEDIPHCEWLQKRVWQRYKPKAAGILRRGRRDFHDPGDQRKHPGGGAGETGGFQQSAAVEGTQSEWRPRAGQAQSSKAWCDLLVYNPYTSIGRVSHALLLWEMSGLEGALDFTSGLQIFFKDPETFVQMKYNRREVAGNKHRSAT